MSSGNQTTPRKRARQAANVFNGAWQTPTVKIGVSMKTIRNTNGSA
jgi:hypothetical protein